MTTNLLPLHGAGDADHRGDGERDRDADGDCGSPRRDGLCCSRRGRLRCAHPQLAERSLADQLLERDRERDAEQQVEVRVARHQADGGPEEDPRDHEEHRGEHGRMGGQGGAPVNGVELGAVSRLRDAAQRPRCWRRRRPRRK